MINAVIIASIYFVCFVTMAWTTTVTQQQSDIIEMFSEGRFLSVCVHEAPAGLMDVFGYIYLLVFLSP